MTGENKINNLPEDTDNVYKYSAEFLGIFNFCRVRAPSTIRKEYAVTLLQNSNKVFAMKYEFKEPKSMTALLKVML